MLSNNFLQLFFLLGLQPIYISAVTASRYPDWMNPEIPDKTLTSDEDMEKRYQSRLIMSYVDHNHDGKATLDEFYETVPSISNLGLKKETLYEKGVRALLIKDMHFMHPAVFNDMATIIHSQHPTGVEKDFLKAMFQLADTKGRGYVTWSDVARLIVTGGRNETTPRSVMGHDKHGELLAALDTDSSGGLTQQETWSTFKGLIQASNGKFPIELMEQHTAQDPITAQLMKCMDSNGDGYLTENEEPDFLEMFDFNYSGEVERFELGFDLQKMLDECVAGRKLSTKPEKLQAKDHEQAQKSQKFEHAVPKEVMNSEKLESNQAVPKSNETKQAKAEL